MATDTTAGTGPLERLVLPGAKERNFDLQGMRRLAVLLSPFASQAILECTDEIERLRAALEVSTAGPPGREVDMQDQSTPEAIGSNDQLGRARWRMLKVGEKMHKDDECLQEDCEAWLRVGEVISKCIYNEIWLVS